MATNIEVTGKGAIDENKRKKALEILQKNTDTDVLEILAKASSKAGSNEKVRKYKAFL